MFDPVYCCRLTRLQLPLPPPPAQLARSVLPFLSLTLSSLCVQGKLSHLTLQCLGKLKQSLLIKTLKKNMRMSRKSFFCLKKC